MRFRRRDVPVVCRCRVPADFDAFERATIGKPYPDFFLLGNRRQHAVGPQPLHRAAAQDHICHSARSAEVEPPNPTIAGFSEAACKRYVVRR